MTEQNQNDQQITMEELLKMVGLKEVQLHAARETIKIYEDHIRKMNSKKEDKDKELREAYVKIKGMESQLEKVGKKKVGKKKG